MRQAGPRRVISGQDQCNSRARSRRGNREKCEMMKRRDFLRVSAWAACRRPSVGPDRGAFAQSLSDQAGALGGRLCAGRLHRHSGAPDGPIPDARSLNQQFVIENKPGAGNNIGTEFVINSPPDGYTVYLVNPANGINASLYKKLNLQLRARHGAGRRHHARAERHDRPPRHAGEDRRRVHRLRKSQPEQGQPDFVRQRHVGASVGRAVHDDDRDQADTRAVQGIEPRAHRHGQRPGVMV